MELKPAARALIMGCSLLLLIALISCGRGGVDRGISEPYSLEKGSNAGNLQEEKKEPVSLEDATTAGGLKKEDRVPVRQEGTKIVSNLGKEVKVPVRIENASNIGSLHIELVYDPDILQATEMKAGELAKNAIFESSLETPGRAMASIIDVAGINGNGAVLEGLFTIVGEGTSPLTLEGVEAFYANTLYDVIIECSTGNIEGSSVTAPVVICRE